MPEHIYDVAVIGGGINGCGIARDAAGRGLSVVLCEQGDLGGATSSASTKLVHGGLRYLEHYQFRLVREALFEREVLLRAAPHVVRPLRFILPHHAGLRPQWILRLGLFVYDHLGTHRTLPATATLNLRRDVAGRPLKNSYRVGLEYSDCLVDDTRLVILNAIDARDRGAIIHTRTRCVAASRQDSIWNLKFEHSTNGERFQTSARAVVNAAGPWVPRVLRHVVGSELPSQVRMVKGSHIVLPRLFDHDRAYIFQNSDRRVVFAIPYERDFSLIGTTDEDYDGDPAAASASEQEVFYLCSAASEYFEKPVDPKDIVWTFSGVRSLYDDGVASAQEATRDYVISLDAPPNQAPLVSVIGGKITTFRRLAENVLDQLAPYFLTARQHPARPWTANAVLPGGDISCGMPEFINSLQSEYRFLTNAEAERLGHAYGTRAHAFLKGARQRRDLGREFGGGLTEAEVAYLSAEEWAQTPADVLWRRSKLGLRLDKAETAVIARWMAGDHIDSAGASPPTQEFVA